MSDHARLSPSGSKKWFACPGSLTLESFIPNTSNEYSDDGTACHHVLEWCLKKRLAGDTEAIAADLEGQDIAVNGSAEEERTVEFTDAMAEKTQTVLDAVLALAGDDILTAEERVDFSEDIAVPNSFGTLDICVVRRGVKELCIGDAKFGYRPVHVERNTQLMTYALAKYRQIEMFEDIETVRLWIFQPMLRAEPYEWTCTIEELLAFASTLRSKGCSVQLAEREFWATPEVANQIIDVRRLFERPSSRLKEWSKTFLNPRPNDEECAFCRAISFCPSAADALQVAVDENFEVVAEDEEMGQQVLARVERYAAVPLSAAMKISKLMEDWITAVRAETERRLLNGEEVADFGLELGRQGARQWKSTGEAEIELKTMRLRVDEMYTLKLISPTVAEKLAKVKKAKKGEPAPPPATIGPRQWKKLQDMITRSDPKPSVKPLALITELYRPTQPDASAFSAVADDASEDLS